MTPEERLFNIILDEIKGVKTAVDNVQTELRLEIKTMQAEMHRRDLEFDRLKTRISTYAAVIAALVAAGFQFVKDVFF